ncbi:protein adenylyltransferase SelO [Cytobacillus firmus]|uniref:protein adenylyltransferase SelO n=1 Tax=Cytobacillus firmus TaxID=1399 RepID=UPI0022283B02|nr:YdiU family protein [Cytobacillus firmus]
MTTSNEAGWNFEYSYARLPQTFFSKVKPNPVQSPDLVILNEPLAKSLGLNIDALTSEAGIEVLSGCQVPEDAEPLAQAYAGHQFGHFNMLGDGRAMLIGEHLTPKDKRVDIQLKGSGRTPFSRGGDGRAALGPMLREYIISEAMHALGIPTTRSLAVVTTGEAIIRETELPGAILTRVADSHIRVGTFQYAANWRPVEELKTLADYTIQRHYPEIIEDDNPYLALLQKVIQRQAALIAKWQLTGFIHGVMNTDNMAISGETIDYGPCAFMDKYDLATVFSSIDREGRYAYGNQPYIGGWNLARFAESLLPLLHENEEEAVNKAQDAISEYNKIYQNHWLEGMRAKLGIFNEEVQDEALFTGLLKMMQKSGADYTNTFRSLTLGKLEETSVFNDQEFADWHGQWQARLNRQKESKEAVNELMRKSNPSVIPRNHRVEEALEAAVNNGDYSVMKKLLAALKEPYTYTIEQEEYCKLPELSGMPYRTFCGT